ncbi:MAG: GDP-mannose 4,6-dehydratase, partial [Sphaerochaetaceae bacterium]|nr:GDP-mannose 4,6-dehydratase [Sphaerochaetaceae bacterium]
MSVILVTGGAGFIGSHVCEALLEQGNSVISVDNYNDFYDPELKRNNTEIIRHTAEDSAGSFWDEEGDIRDEEFLDDLFTRYTPDAVIHLAAYAGVRPSIENPELYMDVNLMGTTSLLEMMKIHGVRRHVFASSSSVYGNNTKVPFSESDPVDRAISPYAATKKAGEVLCHTYYHLYGINTACLRFFTVYGPRQRPDLAISKFMRLMGGDEPIPFFGDGTSERDYTYIDDIVQGVLSVLDWTESKESRFDIFNLGNSSPVSLSFLVESIERVVGKKAILDRYPLPPGDVNRTFADISHAVDILGYEPATSL